MTRAELLRVEGITKAYPGVVANSDVSFSIGEGEIHALLGENGAGKSTMVKMIYGLVRPDSAFNRSRRRAASCICCTRKDSTRVHASWSKTHS